MSDSEKLITFEDACQIVTEQLTRNAPQADVIDVRNAVGRMLLEDQYALLNLPPFNKSAMDGYAVLKDDQRDEYLLLEVVAAGRMPTQSLVPGTTIKVMTGAPVPAGTGQVIRIEYTEERDGMVRVLTLEKGSNICCRGEDIHSDDIVLRAPVLLGALEIANLLACGVEKVKVARALRVGIISTGDEIAESAAVLEPGQILDANGPLLAALCRQHGLEVVIQRLVVDERDATISAIQGALAQVDILILSGGVSVGDFDYVTEALAAVGLSVHFNRVAIKPGKPLTFATSAGKTVFGLPGNPVSVYLMFHLFIMRAVMLLQGKNPEMREISLPLAADFSRRHPDRLEYVPCILTAEGTLRPVDYHGSAHLLALLQSDGFMVIPLGVQRLNAGERVNYMPTRWRYT